MDPSEFILSIKIKIEELVEQKEFIDENLAWEHEHTLLEIHQLCETYLIQLYDYSTSNYRRSGL